jgi:hypothetical protein
MAPSYHGCEARRLIYVNDGRLAPTPRSVASKRRSCSDLVRSTGAATGEGQAEEQPGIDAQPELRASAMLNSVEIVSRPIAPGKTVA